VASVLGAVSVVALSSCSGPTPKAGRGSSSSSTSQSPTAACSPSSVSASVDFTTIGGSSTSPAGAVLFSNTSTTPCSLRGIPTVQLVGADGQVIPALQAPSKPANEATAVLTPAGTSGTGKRAGSSITWSSLTCLAGSYSLTIQFPGWSSSVPAGSTSGYSGPACTAPDTTVYVSPVEPVTASSTTASTTTVG
jgi:hypothetical protein